MTGEKPKYIWTKRVLTTAGVLYVAVALQRRSVPGREEIFPIAPWSLFSQVPNDVHDFSLVILEVDGQRVTPPAYFEKSGDTFPAARLNAARMSIQRLGQALQKHDANETAAMRKLVEDVHLAGPTSVRYEVVARAYDPIERWRHGTITSQKTLATFEMNSSNPPAPATQPAAAPTAAPVGDQQPGARQ